jgi:hypothetical protein
MQAHVVHINGGLIVPRLLRLVADSHLWRPDADLYRPFGMNRATAQLKGQYPHMAGFHRSTMMMATSSVSDPS